MVKFSEIISESIEWTGTVLFRPFRLKKWVFLAFIALLAGQLSGSFNSSGNYSPQKKANAAVENAGQAIVSSQTDTRPPVISTLRSIKQGLVAAASDRRFGPIAWGIGVIVLFLVLVLLWLSSRFTFIFLDDVVRNDASIRRPFGEFRRLGNSLWGFLLVVGIISLLLAGLSLWGALTALLKAGVLEQPFQWLFVQQALRVSWPFLLLLFVFFVAAVGVQLFTQDFVVPVMYKEAVGVCAAWRRVLHATVGRIKDVLVYIVLKIGLYIVSVIAVMLVSFISLAGLIFQGLIGVFVAAGIYKVSPVFLHLPYKIVFFVVAIPAIVLVAYFFLCLSLPIAVFFRTMSVTFISRLIPAHTFLSLCRHCAAQGISDGGYCVSCAAIKKGEAAPAPYRAPVLAAIMSFIIGGFGQIYNGQVAKGLLIFCTSWLIIPWIIGIRDAYVTAQKINRGGLVPKKRYGCLVGMAIGVAALAFMAVVLVAAIVLMSPRGH